MLYVRDFVPRCVFIYRARSRSCEIDRERLFRVLLLLLMASTSYFFRYFDEFLYLFFFKLKLYVVVAL